MITPEERAQVRQMVAIVTSNGRTWSLRVKKSGGWGIFLAGVSTPMAELPEVPTHQDLFNAITSVVCSKHRVTQEQLKDLVFALDQILWRMRRLRDGQN